MRSAWTLPFIVLGALILVVIGGTIAALVLT